jgi:hypothetical protein
VALPVFYEIIILDELVKIRNSMEIVIPGE